MVLFILTSAIASGIMLMRNERGLNDDGDELLRARLLAESGLQRIIGDRTALGLLEVPTANDSVRVTVSGSGYYDVTSTIIRPAASPIPALVLLRSHAVISRAKVASMPTANYTVSVMARGPSLSVAAAWTIPGGWTSANGVNVSGRSATYSGIDGCATNPRNVAAMSVPTLALDKSGFEGSETVLRGSPLLGTLAATAAKAADSVPIDWQNLRRGSGITPTTTDTFPSAKYFTDNPSAWPLIFINNPGSTFSRWPNYAVRGLVIVVGNLVINGNASFQGLIVTGGYVNMDGTSTFQGAMITGLDFQIGGIPQPNELRGTKTTQYNSCYVSSALTGRSIFTR
jgi:hypothetical protein